MSFYVTTPIYYVNAAPHLGHAYTTIGADVLARHMRQRGEDVFFLTGTDEHGEPVALAAEREGVSPQQLADRNAERFAAMMPLLDVSNDFFIRTSDPEHVVRVQQVLQRVRDNGHVYKGIYEGWYCPRCADFKSDTEIGPEHTCPIHGIALVWESEENYFFRLSSFQQRLEELYAERPDFVAPAHHFNEARSFIGQGLQDVSLTRGKLRWGVPVPWDPEHVFYVWFDALLNYYTALGFARPGEDLTSRYWPANFHIIGKDILKFHAVFWPALLMAADIELPRRLFVHGFLLMDEQTGASPSTPPKPRKMSKSLGNVLDPFEIIERFGTDALRYYCFREVSFGRDGSVSAAGFEARYESELANEFGNLASRTIAMVERFREHALPAMGLDEQLAEDFQGLHEEVAALMDRAELSQVLELIWQRVRRLNRYVEEQAPWKLARDEERAEDLGRVLASLVDGLRVVTLLLIPYMPAATARLLDALGVQERSLAAARFGGGGGGGGPIRALEPLFPKLERTPPP